MQKSSIETNNLKYKELLVQKLGIFELRALARELGIASPTTKKRDELVLLIVDKLQNGQTKNFDLTKRGRPFKKLSSIDQILDCVADSAEENFFQRTSFDDLMCFEQEKPQAVFINDKKEILKGVVRHSNSTLYFIDIDNNFKVFINDEMIEKYNLDKGDFIVCNCVGINSNNQFLAQEIIEINFTPAEKWKKSIANLGKEIISNQTMLYGKNQVVMGRRNLVVYDKDIYEDERFSTFVKNAILKGTKVVVLGCNISYENNILFNNIENLIKFITVYGSSVQSSFNKIVDAIAFIEKQTELGEKVVLFVCDVVELVRALDKYFKTMELGEDSLPQSLVVLQKLMSLGKAYEDGSFTTLLLTSRALDKDDLILKNEVIKLCNVIDLKSQNRFLN